jgi:hypothetical protein
MTEDTPFSAASFNTIIGQLLSAINALAGEGVLVFGTAPGNDGTGYVPETGGTYYGQIAAPSVLLGLPSGTQHLAISAGDLASTATAGVVKKAAAVADLGLTISSPPTQGEVDAIMDKVNALLAALRAAGSLAT